MPLPEATWVGVDWDSYVDRWVVVFYRNSPQPERIECRDKESAEEIAARLAGTKL
jgi:hypothetical protein